MLNLKKPVYCALTFSLFMLNQSVFATPLISGSISPTRLQTPIILEGTEVYNNVVIRSACFNGGNPPVIGQTVVFPNGSDSTVTINGIVSTLHIDNFLSYGPSHLNRIESHDAFLIGGSKSPYGVSTFPEAEPPIIGFWGGNGQINGNNHGLIPFSTDAMNFTPASCAKSVTLVLAIADVCQITSVSGFNNGTVNLWTPVVGSDYDGSATGTSNSYNSPATLTVTRNLTTNPLPSSCGAGVDVTVTPSATQLNNDMPVYYNGQQVWPTKK